MTIALERIIKPSQIGVRRCGRKRRGHYRRLKQERLECRWLLAAPEGSVFSLPQQTVETVGLVGDLSASIGWGDGRETAVSVNTPDVANNIRFRFDYSLDTNNFFSDQKRRDALQAAGRSVTQYFTDQLSAISPSGGNTWTANTCHPSQGPSNQLCGMLVDVSQQLKSVAANELVIFPGARDLIGSVRGTGGAGGYSAVGTQSWLDIVAGRGQSGALQNPQTDFGPWGGSISFDDTDTDWYFEKDIDRIGPDQVDFHTVAAHELIHILGFGVTSLDNTSSWERLTPGAHFIGAQATNAYIATGSPPVDTQAAGGGLAKSHWAESIAAQGQVTLMSGQISTNQRRLMSRLDLAALDDLGWQVSYPNSAVIGKTDHVYGDDDNYAIELIVRGSVFGEVTKTFVSEIDNVAPRLTVPPTQTVIAGETLTLPEPLWQIVDPGYGTSDTNPPTAETFSYAIDWKDGSDPATGGATVTQVGDAARDTIATFSASHTYAEVGDYRVVVTVADDDGGSDSETFTVHVIDRPELELSLSKTLVAENDGDGAATLTVTRSGPPKDTDQTVTLSSNDESEATIPGNVVIAAGKKSASVLVDAEDDAILDGTQTVTLTASAPDATEYEIELSVADVESLTAEISADEVRENDASTVTLRVMRSNTDTDESLEISVTGGDPGELEMPNSIIIEAGKREVVIPLRPIDDEDPEATQQLSYTFSAANYESDSIDVELLDNEPPMFQNPQDRFDVDAKGAVTAGDALRVINVIRERAGEADLDPESEMFDGVYVDVTGDYKVSALDALQVINEIARRLLNAKELEFEAIEQNLALPIQRVATTLDHDDTLTVLALDPGRIF